MHGTLQQPDCLKHFIVVEVTGTVDCSVNKDRNILVGACGNEAHDNSHHTVQPPLLTVHTLSA